MYKQENVSTKLPFKKCAVASCKSQGKIVFNFPNPAKQWKKYLDWLHICNNKELNTIRPEKVIKSYGICGLHFDKKNVVVHDIAPTLQLPIEQIEKNEEVYEASQLCRLCFNVGNIDLFSCKYYSKMLKDIVKTCLPIEIRKTDVSTVICQNCKCEIIRFYNFWLKSLQVDEYFQAVNKEASNEEQGDINDIADVTVVEPTIPSINIEEDVEIIETTFRDKFGGDVFEIEDTDPLATSTNVNNVEINEEIKEETLNYVPQSFIDTLHNYVKNPYKPRKLKRTKPAQEEQSPALDETAIDSNTVIKNPCKSRKPKRAKAVQEEQSLALDEAAIDSNTVIKNTCKRRRPKRAKPAQEEQILKLDEAVKDSDTIICIHCNKVIDSLDDFQAHCKLENHDPIFTCSECNSIFKNQIDLDNHLETHNKNENSICDRCGKQFNKKDSLSTHLNTVHNSGELKYACAECPKKFATNKRLKSHIRVHTNDRPYCCEQCGAVFTQMVNLRNHQIIHSDYKPHVCLICNKAFRRKYKLVIHLKKHTGERKYSCDKCGIFYKHKVGLTRHNRARHTNVKEEIDVCTRNCTQCDYTCKFATQLKMHMMRVHKSYTCTVCNTVFKRYQRYYYHMFKHYPNKMKFVCIYCNKRFVNAAFLKLHMVVHTGKKNFECAICMKKFSQKPHLKSHILTHTGERPYKCKHCSKSFAHLYTLVVHERIHTGETPYVCEYCNKGFGHLTNYKKHVFSKHGIITPKTRDYSAARFKQERYEEIEVEENNKEIPTSFFDHDIPIKTEIIMAENGAEIIEDIILRKC